MTGTWASGFAVGDIELAAEYRKGIGSIFDSTLGASAANVDITGIVGTYAHLWVRVYARGDNASLNVALNMRLNGDSAGNYDYQFLRGSAAVVSAGESFAQTQSFVGNIPAATAGANLFSAQEIFIPHYAGSANNKLDVGLSSMKQGTTSASMFVDLFGGFWRSSAAINRVTLLPSAGNFVAGTRVTIHALGA